MTKRANGEGSVYQKPDGVWVAQINLGWIDGKCKRKYVSAKTKAEASRKLRALLSDRDAGRSIATRVPTIEMWFDTYINDVAAKRVRESTLQRYKSDVRNHIKPTLGRIRLDQLRPVHLSDLYNAKLTSGLSATSVRHLHAVIRRALNVAMRWQLISVNPARLVEPPTASRQQVQGLSATQAKQLLAAAADDRLEARWAVGLTLGLRQGEVLGLAWDDVDIDAGVLHVRRALQRQHGRGLVFTQPKTARSRRTLPIPKPLAQLLRSHRLRQLEERLRAGDCWQESGCVFATESGTPIDPKADWRAFKELLSRADLPDVRLHDLRHTAASLLLLQGVPARVVMEILGHSQISMTMNTYSHVAPELQEEAMTRMSLALWG